jgi:NAD(P)H-flavin reductase
MEKNPTHSISLSKTLQDSIQLHNKRKATSKIGFTFLLHTHGDLTSQLRSLSSLPVLVESPYGPHEDLSAHTLLIAITGGVGITTMLPLLRSHPGNSKLFWGTRTEGIVHELEGALANVEKETFVGHRMNVASVSEKELVTEVLEKALSSSS